MNQYLDAIKNTCNSKQSAKHVQLHFKKEESIWRFGDLQFIPFKSLHSNTTSNFNKQRRQTSKMFKLQFTHADNSKFTRIFIDNTDETG